MFPCTIFVLPELHLELIHAHQRDQRAEAERLALVRDHRDRAPVHAGRRSVASLVAPFRT